MSTAAPPMLEVRDLEVRYGARPVVRRTSLALEAGEIVALVGPNGAGKSSLLKALAGLLPHAGTVSWSSQPLDALEPRARARVISYLPQAPALHWPIYRRRPSPTRRS